MQIKHALLVMTVLALGIPTFSYAQDRRGGRRENESQGPRDFHPRLRKCHERIDRGISNGDLTREEAHRLKRELDNVRDDFERMKADGRLNHRESERLDRELSRLERHISELKHNDNSRRHRR